VIDNIIKTVSPECVVLGGSLMELLPEYYALVTERAGHRLYDPAFQATQLFPFSYGEIQSAMGAVKLVLTEFFLSLNN
jgi:predicted NBD/HSP70 family sugar kinase